MSDAVSYLSEPATSGKVVLHTTIGDLDLELFSQQTPQTCRTFLSLALRHAYDGCTFHRIERDFLAQTGDLASSTLSHTRLQRVRAAEWYNTPLKPELHSRLRFNRRGLVGLARSAKPLTTAASTAASPLTVAVEDNAQFFITLAATPELNGTHTLFGKVTGDTLYNLTRLNDTDVAAPNSSVLVRINSVELLSCPWQELVEGVDVEEREWRERKEEEERRRKKKEDGSSRLGKRNVNALSFGADEVEEREEERVERRKKGKGLHDVLDDDRRLVATDDEGAHASNNTSRPMADPERPDVSQLSDGEGEEDEDDGYDTRMRERVLRDKLASTDNVQPTSTSTSSTDMKQQIRQLTQQLFPVTSTTSASSDNAASRTPAVSALEQRKQRFMQQKRPRPNDSASTDTMAKLAHFRTKIQHAAQPTNTTTDAATDEQKHVAADWVTASASLLREADDEEEMRVRQQERAEGMAWMRHRLQFARRPQDYAAEQGTDDGLVVFDPTGKEGSTEVVRMGRKGLGIESSDRRRDGSRERDSRRDDRGTGHTGRRPDSRERRDKAR